MDCRTFHRRLEDYLQGGMDFAGRFGVERHAQQCYSCGAALKEAVRLGQMARELNRVKAPPDFEAALLRRIQTCKPQRRGSELWRFWTYGKEQVSWQAAILGAVAMALVAVGIFALAYRGERGRIASFQGRAEQPLPAVSSAQSPAVSGARSESLPAVRGASPEILHAQVIPVGEASSRYFLEEDFTLPFVNPADVGFVEYPVAGSGDRQLLMRLPKSIRLRYGPPTEDYFVRKVSH